MSSYDQHRGRRGASTRGGGYVDRSSGDRSQKRSRDDDRGGNRPGQSENPKFQKRGGGRGRGRGRGGAKKTREEFVDSVTTRTAVDKHGRFNPDTEEKVQLCANYFKVYPMNVDRRVRITMYHVIFKPFCEERGNRYGLMRQLGLGTSNYDGSASIYLMQKLRDKVTKFDAESRDGRRFIITLAEKNEILTTDAMFFTILNLIIRNAMDALKLQLVGRNYYDAANKIDMPALRLQIWPGYITSIRQHEQNLLLGCELVKKVMRNETVYSIIEESARSGRDYKTNVNKRLIGTTVLTSYNNMTYKINDIDWDSNPNSKFTQRDGTEKSYIDYYRERYSLEINDHKQPLLISKATAKALRGGSSQLILLIPELCRTTGIEDNMRNNFEMMRTLANETRMTPAERVEKLLGFNRRLQTNPKSLSIFENNEVRLDTELVRFEGRRLQQQKIEFGNGEKVDIQTSEAAINKSADWTNCLKNKRLYVPTKLDDAWVFIYAKKMEVDAETFLSKLISIGNHMGMMISEKALKRVALPNDNIKAYLDELRKHLSRDVGFIMVGVTSVKVDLYSAIKRAAFCSERSNRVPIQVVVQKTMRSKIIDSVATKVAIQINCKLGGTPWNVSIPLESLMVIGFDVSHGTADKKNSYGAMVAYFYNASRFL